MPSTRPGIRMRRVYDDPSAADGTRVLVDRIWPRGMSKERAHLDEWCKQIAPSTELRKWYGHAPARFDEFTRRYSAELDDSEHTDALNHLRALAQKGTVTLLTATKDIEISEAAVLVELIGSQRTPSGRD